MERPSTASRRSTPLMTPGSASGMRASAAIRLGTALTPGTAMRMGTAGGAELGERPMTSNKVGADLCVAGLLCDTRVEEEHLQCICHCRSNSGLVGFRHCCIPPANGSQQGSHRAGLKAHAQPGIHQAAFSMSSACWQRARTSDDQQQLAATTNPADRADDSTAQHPFHGRHDPLDQAVIGHPSTPSAFFPAGRRV